LNTLDERLFRMLHHFSPPCFGDHALNLFFGDVSRRSLKDQTVITPQFSARRINEALQFLTGPSSSRAESGSRTAMWSSRGAFWGSAPGRTTSAESIVFPKPRRGSVSPQRHICQLTVHPALAHAPGRNTRQFGLKKHFHAKEVVIHDRRARNLFLSLECVSRESCLFASSGNFDEALVLLLHNQFMMALEIIAQSLQYIVLPITAEAISRRLR
jgi:hypothetical protein